MTGSCITTILLVEGPGDVAAIPSLIGRLFGLGPYVGISIARKPKKGLKVENLVRAGEWERYLELCARDEGDSVLLAIDCEDKCVKDVAQELALRAAQHRIQKPVAIALFEREYESMFLHSIEAIKRAYPDYRWLAETYTLEPEKVRGTKERLGSFMSKEKGYKETRDQVKFTQAMELELLRKRSRCFRHFHAAICWLAGQQRDTKSVYP